jgi:cell wall-associated NlpC family hydrolase
MGITLRMPRDGRVSRTRRIAVLGTVVLLAGGLAVAASQVAGAAPKPTVADVQKQVNSLTGQFDKANQQYDQAEEQLTAAKSRLKQVSSELARDQKHYQAARKLVVQIADSTYEDSSSTSLAGLLTAGDPSQVLAQASVILQITDNRGLQTGAFLADAQQLVSVQQTQQRTEAGIAQLADQMSKSKSHIATLLAQQKTILNSLTTTQLTAVQQGTVNGGGGITTASYTGSTSTQAGQALAFAFKQLGCPYSYGSAGPCSTGFDCSGLVSSAWASAGISIPRTTYSEWAALPHVSQSSLQPGDLLFYNGIGHVAIYVGGGMMIDAPSAGQPVRELAMNTDWYAQTFDGAARPLSPGGKASRHGGAPRPPYPPGPVPPGAGPVEGKNTGPAVALRGSGPVLPVPLRGPRRAGQARVAVANTPRTAASPSSDRRQVAVT